MPNEDESLLAHQVGNPTRWIAIVSIGILAGVIGYAVGLKNITPTPTTIIAPPVAVTKEAKTASDTTTVTTKEVDKPSTTVSVDDTWNRFTSFKKGFSIKIPKETLLSSCEKDASTGYYSTTSTTKVPTKVFEDDQATYPEYEYTYQLGGEVKKDGQSYFTTCTKVARTVADFQQKAANNGIRIKDIKSESELDAFLKSNYGAGCSLGDKTESGQPGTFNVKINGDGKDLGETKCPVNYKIMLKYSPDKKKLAYWSLGQDFIFPKSGGDGYDNDMLASFKFE